MSEVSLQAIEVNVGAGELKLNVAGKYPEDVTATVNGGAGEARIRPSKDMGAVVDAHAGIGGIGAEG